MGIFRTPVMFNRYHGASSRYFSLRRCFYSTPGKISNRPFAIIKVGGEVIEEPHVRSLVAALKVLQEADRPCAIVHGGGPQLNDELKLRKIEPNYVKGHRVTDEVVLGVAKDVFTRLNARLVQVFEENGIKCCGFPSHVFGARTANPEMKLGFVGEVEHVFSEGVEECLAQNKIPVLASLGVNLSKISDPSKQDLSSTDYLNINADVAARELATALDAKKVVFTSSRGGWIENEEIVRHIDLSKEYTRLKSMDYTGRQGTLLKLEEIKLLLENLPCDSSVTICSSDKILDCLEPSQSSEENPGSTFVLGKKKRETPIRVGLIGARGYVGVEFCKLVNDHPNLDLVLASSRQNKGKNVFETFGLNPSKTKSTSKDLLFTSVEPDEIGAVTKELGVDLWVLALPNGLSVKFSTKIDELNQERTEKIKQIDLSADNRFQPESEWVYGLPEKKQQREKLKTAIKISNPGCYATGMQAALMPLMLPLRENKVKLKSGTVPVCFGVSGYSGAGTTPSRNNDEKFLDGNLIPYKLFDHIHERECSRFLESPINFSPHVGQFFQGIHLTINCFLEADDEGRYPDRSSVISTFRQYYEGEKLIKINEASGELNTVKSIQKQHYVEIGGFQIDPKTGRLVMTSLIDNLLKGAATQALQNINISFGLDEFQGISEDV